MRRKDKQVLDPEKIEKIIAQASVMRMALFDEPFPYLVPVNFGYHRGAFYFHSALEGKKLDLIKKNNRVCFEAEADFQLIEGDIPCRWSVQYASIIGFGKAYLITDREDKRKGLEIIFRHYSQGPFEMTDTEIARVAVIRIDVESVTGKASLKPEGTAQE
jgi:uncharacterized protein